MNHAIESLSQNLGKVIRGKEATIELTLVALCSGGHILIEDVPGVGKTTLAKALARSIRGDFRRIQFTPDLLPTDIVGGMIYSPTTGQFSFRPGPVFCHVLLADEINRASPRTQSALLEAMNEGQATIEGERHPLPSPFITLATQNPVEYHGTYPLPEAQLDRFAMRIEVGYPDQEEEMRMVLDQRTGHPLEELSPVTTADEVGEIIAKVREVDVEESVARYMIDIVRATRQDPRLQLGASPRAALVIYRTCQALAMVRGRPFVIPDDVKELAVPVIAHRVVLDVKATYSGVRKQDIIRDLVTMVAAPV